VAEMILFSCKEIEDLGMKYIGANLKELEFLEKVELNFHG